MFELKAYHGRGKVLGWILVVVLVVVVVGLLLPMCNLVRGPHPELYQRMQFHSIKVALDMFAANSGYGSYPPSHADGVGVDVRDGTLYCGANKLTEALVGRDLLGFHPESQFRADGMKVDESGGSRSVYDAAEENVSEREGPFIELENANAYRLGDIYGADGTGAFDPASYVLCDEFRRERKSGIKTGMPILYCRADVSKSINDVSDPDNAENIYDYRDNHALLELGIPDKGDAIHPMYNNPKVFYEMINNDEVTEGNRPFRAKSFVLISAGKDGRYGTKDDILIFSN